MLKLKQVKQSFHCWNEDVFGDLKSWNFTAQQRLTASHEDISYLGFTEAWF